MTLRERARADLETELEYVTGQLEDEARDRAHDLDEYEDPDEAQEQAEQYNADLTAAGNPFRLQYDEPSESWEWFVPDSSPTDTDEGRKHARRFSQWRRK